MQKILGILFILFFCFASLSFSEQEEFCIITSAPIPVSGGMIRHFVYTDAGRVSVRYSFKGVEENEILIEKITSSGPDGTEKIETLHVPLKSSMWGKKKGTLEIGTHKVELTLNKHGRITVKEV